MYGIELVEGKYEPPEKATPKFTEKVKLRRSFYVCVNVFFLREGLSFLIVGSAFSKH